MKCYVMLEVIKEFLTLTAVSVQFKNKKKNKSFLLPILYSYIFLPHDCCLSRFNLLHIFSSTFSNYTCGCSDKTPVASVNTLLPYTVVNKKCILNQPAQ